MAAHIGAVWCGDSAAAEALLARSATHRFLLLLWWSCRCTCTATRRATRPYACVSLPKPIFAAYCRMSIAVGARPRPGPAGGPSTAAPLGNMGGAAEFTLRSARPCLMGASRQRFVAPAPAGRDMSSTEDARGVVLALPSTCSVGLGIWGGARAKCSAAPNGAARGSPASEAGDGLTLPGNGLRCVLVAREVTMTGLSSSTWLAALQAPPKRVRLMPEVEPVSLPPVVDLGRASKEENPPAPMLSTGLEEWNEADRTGTRRPVSQPKPGECVRWGSSSRMRPREGSNAVGKHSDAQLALAANRHELLAWRMPEATGLPVPRRLRGGQAGITSSEDWDRHMTVSCVQSNGADSDVQEGIGSGWLSSSEPRPCFDSWEPASGTGASVSCSALKPGVAPVSELEVGAPLGV